MRNNIGKYYILQGIAWGLVALQQILISVVFNDFRVSRSLFLIFLSVAGFLFTNMYRVYALRRQVFDKSLAYQMRVGLAYSVLCSFVLGLISYYGAVVFLLNKKTTLPDLRFLSIVLNFWIIIGSWAFLYHLYKYFQQLLQKSEQKWQLQKKWQETEADLLQMQINPHFLFNALNTIRVLLLLSPEQATVAIRTLGKLLMEGYLKVGFGKIHIIQEMAIVHQYMTIEKMRFGDKLHFEANVPETLHNALIPAGVILTLVENAVKHGFRHTQTQNQIYLYISQEVQEIKLSVVNTGKLTLPASTSVEPSGIGLQNVEKRLGLYFQNAFNIEQFDKNSFVHTNISWDTRRVTL